jgi:protoporphyrinogen oxidase
VLNGTGQGLVNHVCVPSDVSERYAPAGAALVSVSIIGVPELDDHDLSRQVTQELREWFGEPVAGWNLLRIYRIERALPVLTLEASPSAREPIHDGVLLCGDYLEDPSINGALVSGRNAAEAVLSAQP